MSHYLIAKEMLAHSQISAFIKRSLYAGFQDGYAFQNPHYPGKGPWVEIFIKNMTSEKSTLFAEAMRVMAIEISYPSGVTRQIQGSFRAEIRKLKRMLIDISGIEPDDDQNLSVNG